ncbi:pectin acetylesterase-family hydrolase [Butyrivibrio sp. MC2013]|uniref:pectin acetylesterase-family hydrolase n=1 Tax=Butyrivibrio sp. MC2013 TaxID=1280686 RepID=UPI0003FD54E5|nr:pectin acetylesterase-family hydrolase [Butyrivibrio sp. MC2013]
MTDTSNGSKGPLFAYKMGERLENRLGEAIRNTSLQAPVLEEGMEAEMGSWYRVPLADGMSGDGSAYHIYVKKAQSKDLIIFFSGGGVAWNEYTAARPSTGGRITAGEPNFYWNNLRPFTQIMNIKVGITEDINPRNLFKDWNQLVISYATGDLHVGRNEFPYKDEEGKENILHFHGYDNYKAAMEAAKGLFPDPERLLIAGDSAGGFAVPALAEEIADDHYPLVRDITLLSDSSLLLYDKWKETARDIWRCPDHLWQAIESDNITLDWYKRLVKSSPGRFRCLYASSVRDYLLAAYLNDMEYRIYGSYSEVQEEYFDQMKEMIGELKELDAGFHFFISDFKNMMLIKGGMRGGTTHTLVRTLNFHNPGPDGVSMERWLYDAVNGDPYSCGLSLIRDEP